MTIDDQLLNDCYVLGCLKQATVLLHRNAAVGWLILVPDTQALDWHEFGDAEYARVVTQLRELTAFTARYFAADKVNVAALGNVTRQMHVHVIARHRDDACWPKPVWGHLDVERSYPLAEVDALRDALAEAMGLVAGGLT